MEIDNLWKAEKWEPEKLMALYKRAGAKYFVALANHHDNLDAYDSKYHAWNSVNVGPKQDIVGTWAKVARANGLRFGVTNHSSHAWHWFQPAYGHDARRPAGRRALRRVHLTKADGKGKWWDGLDPQELYTGPNMAMPEGMTNRPSHARLASKKTIAAGRRIRRRTIRRSRKTGSSAARTSWTNTIPTCCISTTSASFRSAGPGSTSRRTITTASKQWYDGKLEAVINVKGLDDARRPARGRGLRAWRQRRDPARAVADRHLHRRLALQPPPF
jgi:alpha-L-fucosidase